PGYDWRPAWVSWRTGGNYIRWVPLPPETGTVHESRPLTGHIDVEIDIGRAYYNFCDVRYNGEPALGHRLVPYQPNGTGLTPRGSRPWHPGSRQRRKCPLLRLKKEKPRAKTRIGRQNKCKPLAQAQ